MGLQRIWNDRETKHSRAHLLAQAVGTFDVCRTSLQKYRLLPSLSTPPRCPFLNTYCYVGHPNFKMYFIRIDLRIFYFGHIFVLFCWFFFFFLHLILISPSPLLPPSIFPSIRVFSNESVLHIRWPKYWSFSISPSNEYSELISFRIDWFDLLAVQGTPKSLLQHHSSKASILRRSAFCIVQPSHPYMTTRKTIDLIRWFLFYS